MPSLSWLHKQNAEQAAVKVPHHLLTVQSVHGDATSENLLIQGDNLLALKALLPVYRGRVKCIFIDPPYNTQSAFDHYNDRLEHSLWLSMMFPRLQLLRELLSEDGSIWVTIDDNEAHYLKVMLDEVFGRPNFVCNGIWQKKSSPQNDEKLITAGHDHILIYARNKGECKFNQLPRTAQHDASFENPDNDPRGPWSSGDMTSKTKAAGHSYPVKTPKGVTHLPPAGRQWAPSLETFNRWTAENRIWFGKSQTNKPRVKQFLSEIQGGIVPMSIWMRDEVGDNQSAKREVLAFNDADIFDTPKPENLVRKAIHLATSEGDLVLDSFLGSGTTAAVAHKMGRRYIGIEMGEHARTHCLPRLEKVVAGEQGGISKSVNWQGGGGFRFATLGNPIFDELGRIDTNVQFSDLAAFVWQQETGTSSGVNRFTSPCLGEHNGVQYFLLFNGILGDKRPDGGNVLNYEVWDALVRIYPFDGPRVVFGEAVKLPPTIRTRERVMFKKIPYTLRGQGTL